jgi:hypothetical protein
MSVCATKVIGGCLVQLIREDACGVPLVGQPNNMIRTKGFVSLSLTPDIEAATTITERTACGELCVNERTCPITKGLTGKMKICNSDPALLELLLGYSPILDANLDFAGFSMKGESDSECKNLSMIVWGQTTSKCGDGQSPWQAFHLGRVSDFVLSSTLTFQYGTPMDYEIDFYARETAQTYTDPSGIFAPTEVGGRLMSVKCVSTIPAPGEPGTYMSI